MKKIITFACIIAFALALCACDGEVTPDSGDSTLDSIAPAVDSCYSLYGNKFVDDNSQGGTTNTGFGAIKWIEDDYFVEENWQKTYRAYEQYADYFEKMDTSADKFRIYPYFESSSDESDAIRLKCGSTAFIIHFTSPVSSKEALDKIEIGDHWVKVYNCDYNFDCFEWLRWSNYLVKQYSFHYSKEWIYYFEYENFTVKKIVEITPEGMAITGEDADAYTDNLWSEEELQEESWQKIYATYVNAVGYLRSDIDKSSPDFTIKPDSKYRKIYVTIEETNIEFTAYMSRECFLPQLETVRVGEHILDVMSKDPCTSYSAPIDAPELVRYSNHFFNNCVYHIEYENGYVSKIVKITADGIYDITSK